MIASSDITEFLVLSRCEADLKPRTPDLSHGKKKKYVFSYTASTHPHPTPNGLRSYLQAPSSKSGLAPEAGLSFTYATLTHATLTPDCNQHHLSLAYAPRWFLSLLQLARIFPKMAFHPSHRNLVCIFFKLRERKGAGQTKTYLKEPGWPDHAKSAS